MSTVNVTTKGRRAGKRISRIAEARRVLSRAADFKFPTHRRAS